MDAGIHWRGRDAATTDYTGAGNSPFECQPGAGRAAVPGVALASRDRTPSDGQGRYTVARGILCGRVAL